MKDQLLRDSVDLLRRIRAEVQTTVEDSVIHDLDKVIHDLEDIQKRRPNSYDTLEVLLLLGKAIEYLPQIADALQHLKHMLK
jgi:hypothetical protein